MRSPSQSLAFTFSLEITFSLLLAKCKLQQCRWFCFVVDADNGSISSLFFLFFVDWLVSASLCAMYARMWMIAIAAILSLCFLTLFMFFVFSFAVSQASLWPLLESPFSKLVLSRSFKNTILSLWLLLYWCPREFSSVIFHRSAFAFLFFVRRQRSFFKFPPLCAKSKSQSPSPSPYGISKPKSWCPSPRQGRPDRFASSLTWSFPLHSLPLFETTFWNLESRFQRTLASHARCFLRVSRHCFDTILLHIDQSSTRVYLKAALHPLSSKSDESFPSLKFIRSFLDQISTSVQFTPGCTPSSLIQVRGVISKFSLIWLTASPSPLPVI